MSTSHLSEIAIKWSPQVDEEFILVGNSVNFYRLTSINNSFKNWNENNIFVSESTCARLIGSINSYSKQKMISWHPFTNLNSIALFENESSQIRIIRMLDLEEVRSLDVGMAKKCNQIEWSPKNQSYLGLGFEQNDNCSSVCIWDLSQPNNNPSRQLNETGSCLSLAWSYETSDCLFASFENRLSLFDLRAGGDPIESLKTDYIYGFCIDPKGIFKAASFYQNQIALWDLRDYKEPVDFIEESRPIKSIQFCPSRTNRLAVLTENSPNVNVFRLEEREDKLIKEKIQYYKYYKSSFVINSFSWHSKDSNRLMATFTDLNTLKLVDLVVADYSPIGISFNENLNIALNDKVCTVQSQEIDDEIDIGEKMRQRAKNSYGIKSFKENANLLSDNKSELEIKFLWKWLEISKANEHTYFEKFSGVKSILATQPPENLTDDFNKIKREYIFKLCGWFNWSETVTKLESQGEYERAACIAMFNNGFERAIEILKNASKQTNSNEYLALTLSLMINRKGLSNKESVRVLDKISNPYLKALFAYQNDSDYNYYYSIYNDQSIKLQDRVCMAMSILSNEKLDQCIKTFTNNFVRDGNLHGILLTGLNVDCIDLFRFYINRTSDVQTAAVAIINSNCAQTLANKYVNVWIESYKNLLDAWMLWEQRAHFDIKIGMPQDPKVFVRCLSCGNNFSTRIRRQFPNNGMTCQQCQRPSLRCSVCQLYMTVDPPKSAFLGITNKMTYWFLFCQKCSHGGHLGHLESWFRTNPECPVMSCNCQCYVTEDFYEEIF